MLSDSDHGCLITMYCGSWAHPVSSNPHNSLVNRPQEVVPGWEPYYLAAAPLLPAEVAVAGKAWKS